ncbi:MAG: hypothetical protein WD226_01775 [Planctomycetota bacterium]
MQRSIPFALALTGWLFVAGCYGVRSRVRVLDALHDPDGSIRFVAPIQTPQEAFWRDLLRAIPEVDVGDPEPVSVDDPYELTLEHLIGLSRADVDDDGDVALLVSTFAWYGAQDPYVLARERAFEGLGRVAARLEFEQLERLPEEPATPDEVLVDVRAIVAAIGTAQQNQIGWSEGLAAASAALAARPLDLEGGFHTARVLSRLAPLAGDRDAPGWEPFWAAHDEVLRRAAAQSFGLGLQDPEPRVRAAAMLGATRASDGYGQALSLLLQEDPSEEVRVAGLRWLARNGFPRRPRADTSANQEGYEETWVRLVVLLLQDTFEGPVAVWACRALERMTTAELATLRSEEWLEWYFAADRDRGASAQ